MNIQFDLDLFNRNLAEARRKRYPDAPGFKARDTAKHAATTFQSEAWNLRGLCFSAIVEHPSTADEVAMILKRSVLAIRPRLSELVAKNKIVDSGERRLNQSGKPAIVWRTAV